MALARRISAYRVTAPPRGARASGLLWHAVPAAALDVVPAGGRGRGIERLLAPYRATFVPSRTIDLLHSVPHAVAAS